MPIPPAQVGEIARVGFIGVGMMGAGMAANLLRAGRRVAVVAHRNRAPVEALLAEGAEEADSPRALAAGADALFLCLNGSPQVEAVVEQIAAALRPGTLVVDTSTSNPVSTVALQARLAGQGVGFVDAPVTGAPAQAAAGQLNALLGGAPADVERARPLIEDFTRAAVPVGGPGAGHRAKLLNNMVTIGAVALLAEAYRAARAEGLDWAKLYEVMMGGAARSGTLEKMVGPALHGDFTGHKFSLANARKDIDYADAYLGAIDAPSEIVKAISAFLAGEAEHMDADAYLSALLAPRDPE